VDPLLARDLDAGDGLLDRRAALVPRWAIDNARRRGELVHVFPEVYADPTRVGEPRLRWRAALVYAARGAGQAALSHTTALAVWGLRADDALPVHVTVPAGATARTRAGVVVHHHGGGPDAVVRGGLPVARLERTLVESWPLLTREDRRAPAIAAVNGRLTTPPRLREALAGAPRLPGRAELARLIGLLDAGCRSPLEIWGHEQVFTGPEMPAFRRQFPVRLGRRTVYLDVFAERERVDFELDGAAYHGEPAQREIDLRRDAALAACGIQVIRLTHRRLTHETPAVRAEILSILAARRRK